MKTIYLGLELPASLNRQSVVHYPVIQIVPHSLQRSDIQEGFKEILNYTHLIMTSKSAVRLFFEALPFFGFNGPDMKERLFLSVGKATTALLKEYGVRDVHTAHEEHAEGVVELIEAIGCLDGYFFWPHSALSRGVLNGYFSENNIRYRECILYQTISFQRGPPPALEQGDEIVFTSPSTVNGFLAIYGAFPKNAKLSFKGTVTQAYAESLGQELQGGNLH